MIALAAVRGRLHLAQQRVHLGEREATPRAHAAVTCKRRAHLRERALQAARLIERAEVLGHSADQLGHIGVAEQRRHLAHQERAFAERLDHEAQALQLGAPPENQLDLRRVELDHLGHQQSVARHPARRQRRLHPLVHQPFVGRVLIDQHQAALCLRHDIAVVQLGARGAERVALEQRFGVSGGGIPTRAGRAEVERRRAERRLIGGRSLGETPRKAPFRCRSARPERAERGLAQCAREAAAGRAEALPDRADQQTAHEAGVAKAHLRLGRVDVHVHLLGRDLQEQRGHRVAIARQQVAIGGAQRALEQPVLNRATIDEQVLRPRRALAGIGQADQTREAHAIALDLERERIVSERAAHDLAQALAPLRGRIARRRVEREGAPAVDLEHERDQEGPWRGARPLRAPRAARPGPISGT